MFQKFFESSIECKFIKSLLYNTNLPIVNSIAEYDLMIEGMSYVYKNDLIRCTQTGYLVEKTIRCSPKIIVQEPDKLLCGERSKKYNVGRYETLQPFDFGAYYPQLTQRYIPKNAYYDNETHRFLGDYLRCYRDIFSVDLMPFYNCYNYETFKDFHLKTPYPGWENYENESVKVLAVPIKFNKTYTIAIDSHSQVLCKPVFHNEFGMIYENVEGQTKYVTENFHSDSCTVKYYKSGDKDGQPSGKLVLEDANIVAIPNSNFTKPFTFRLDNNKKKYQKLEKYLYLAIQVPSNNNSSVVVIEGDYYKQGRQIVDISSINNLTNDEINKLFTSSLGLLQINTKQMYAFSNRLIEYLLLNVVTSREEIRNNIGLAQTSIGYRDYTDDYNYDVWDNKLRYLLYNKYMGDSKTTKLDITGFVDKDMAEFLNNNKYNPNDRLL
jgi:hypothetical protein